jgi:hypothetical protein
MGTIEKIEGRKLKGVRTKKNIRVGREEIRNWPGPG